MRCLVSPQYGEEGLKAGGGGGPGGGPGGGFPGGGGASFQFHVSLRAALHCLMRHTTQQLRNDYALMQREIGCLCVDIRC